MTSRLNEATAQTLDHRPQLPAHSAQASACLLHVRIEPTGASQRTAAAAALRAPSSVRTSKLITVVFCRSRHASQSDLTSI